jgi:hypothetical protein
MQREGRSAKDASPGQMKKKGASARSDESRGSKHKSRNEARGAGKNDNDHRKASRADRNDSKADRAGRNDRRNARSEESRKNKNRAERNDRNDRRNARSEDDRRGGKGATGAGEGTSGRSEHKSVSLTGDQKRRVSSAFGHHHVAPVRDIGVAVNVGVVIPHSVRLYPLPTDIVGIVPEYRGYEYIMLDDDRVAIIDPDTFEVIDIIVLA